jgi:hypothetical protein
MPYSRTQNYTNSGDFLASEVNADFDELWLAGEQTDRSFSQSIRKPITDSDSISMELPEAATRANKFVKFDATGAVDVAGATVTVSAEDVSIDDAGNYYTSGNVEGALQEVGASLDTKLENVVEDTTPQLGGNLDVNGNDITGTGNIDLTGNLDVSGTATVGAVTYTGTDGTDGQVLMTNGSGVASFEDMPSSTYLDVKDFGATGDGSTDDTTAIQNAINHASNNEIQTIFFPDGHYKYTTLRLYHDATDNPDFQGEEASYTGDGSTTVFAYSWPIQKATDLRVKVDGAIQTLDTDYTVSGVGSESGGNVTFISGAPANQISVSIAEANRDGRFVFLGAGKLSISDISRIGQEPSRIYGSVLESTSGGEGIIVEPVGVFAGTDARVFRAENMTFFADNAGYIITSQSCPAMSFSNCSFKQFNPQGSGVRVRNSWFFSMDECFLFGPSDQTTITVESENSPQSDFVYDFDRVTQKSEIQVYLRPSGGTEQLVNPDDYSINTTTKTISLNTAASTGDRIRMHIYSYGTGVSGATGFFAGLWNIKAGLIDSFRHGVRWDEGQFVNLSIRDTAIQNCHDYHFYAEDGTLQQVLLDNVYTENVKVQGISTVKSGRANYFTATNNQTVFTYDFTNPATNYNRIVNSTDVRIVNSTDVSNGFVRFTVTNYWDVKGFEVYKNWSLVDPADYTVTNETDGNENWQEVSFSGGINVNDYVRVRAFKDNDFVVRQNGNILDSADYSINLVNKTVTLDTGATANDVIKVSEDRANVRTLRMTNPFNYGVKLSQPIIDINSINTFNNEGAYVFRPKQTYINVDKATNNQKSIGEFKNGNIFNDQDISGLDLPLYILTGVIPEPHNVVYSGYTTGFYDDTNDIQLFNPSESFPIAYTGYQGDTGFSKFSFGDTKVITIPPSGAGSGAYEISAGDSRTYYDITHTTQFGQAVHLRDIGAGSEVNDGRVIFIKNNESSGVGDFKYLVVYNLSEAPGNDPTVVLQRLYPGQTGIFVFDGKNTKKWKYMGRTFSHDVELFDNQKVLIGRGSQIAETFSPAQPETQFTYTFDSPDRTTELVVERKLSGGSFVRTFDFTVNLSTKLVTLGTATASGEEVKISKPVADMEIYHDSTSGESRIDTLAGLTLDGLTYPTADGTSGQSIITDGSGNLTFGTAAGTGITAVVEDTTPQLGGDLESNGHDILFADNDKAIFGAGSDLQIYHDGSQSLIHDAGTGPLKVRSSGFELNNAADTEQLLQASENGAVTAFYDGSAKLATTATGIDVTGSINTVLSVDGTTEDVFITGATPALEFVENDNGGSRMRMAWNNATMFQTLYGDTTTTFGSFNLQTRASDGTNNQVVYVYDGGANDRHWWGTRAAGDVRMQLKSNGDFNVRGGDVIFENSAATSDDFFWDASASRLGLGTDSPSYDLSVVGSSAAIQVDNTAGSPDQMLMIFQADMGTQDRNFQIKSPTLDSQSAPFRFVTSNSFAFEIDGVSALALADNKNVGIGDEDPIDKLTVSRLGATWTGVAPNANTTALFHPGTDNATSGSALTIAANASSASAIYFSSATDNDVGLISYSHTDNSMQFRTNNSERMRIDSSGKVGIGTDQPDHLVHLYASNPILNMEHVGNNSSRIYFESSTDGNWGGIKASNASGDRSITITPNNGLGDARYGGLELGTSGATIGGVFDTDYGLNVYGNVGIGTTSPDAAIEVYGDVGTNLQTNRTAVFRHPNTNQGAIEIRNGRGDASIPNRHSSIQSWSNELVNPVDLLLNPEGGNVGIGTDSPAQELDVDGSIALAGKEIARRSGNNIILGDVDAAGGNGALILRTGGGDKVTVATTGAIDMTGDSIDGTTATSFFLRNRVNGGSLNLGVETTAGALYYPIIMNGTSDIIVFKNAEGEMARFDTNGNLLVSKDALNIGSDGIELRDSGAGAFSRTNDVNIYSNRNGTDGSSVDFRKNNSTVGTISVTSSATAYNTSSDQRLKDNIVDAPSASDDIDAIQVRSFDWKADGSHQKYGMVAQELQTVAPDAVSEGDTEDDMMGVDYSKLVPMLVKEIQSLRARVAQLEND